MPKDTPTTRAEASPLFDLLNTGEPEYKKLVLVAFKTTDQITWAIGAFIAIGAELWFQQDKTPHAIPIHTPNTSNPTLGWIYLPN